MEEIYTLFLTSQVTQVESSTLITIPPPSGKRKKRGEKIGKEAMFMGAHNPQYIQVQSSSLSAYTTCRTHKQYAYLQEPSKYQRYMV